jgi:hypothetical protein
VTGDTPGRPGISTARAATGCGFSGGRLEDDWETLWRASPRGRFRAGVIANLTESRRQRQLLAAKLGIGRAVV